MKNTMIAALVALIAIGSTACGPGITAKPANDTTTSAVQAAESNLISVPDVVGLMGDEANDAIRNAGLKADFKEKDGDRTVIVKSNWRVVEQAPAAGTQVDAKAVVTLRATKNEPSTAPETTVAESPTQQLTAQPQATSTSTATSGIAAKPSPKPTATKKQASKPTASKPTASKPPATKPATKPANVYYKNCAAVRAAGKAPLHRGEPGYAKHLDRDGDGIACE